MKKPKTVADRRTNNITGTTVSNRISKTQISLPIIEIPDKIKSGNNGNIHSPQCQYPLAWDFFS